MLISEYEVDYLIKIGPEPKETYKLSPDRDVPLTIFFFFFISSYLFNFCQHVLMVCSYRFYTPMPY